MLRLANHVYEYLIHVGAPKAAQAFLQEIHWEKSWPIGEPPGFLNQWWCVFFDLYSAAPERRETFEHSSEAKAFHDYGFVNSGFPNGLARNPSIASPISGGMPPNGGRPPSSQGIIPPDNGIHTPVSIPGGQMMVQGHFFAPNHPIANLNPQQMDMMRTRSMMHPGIRFPPGPMIGNYHPNTAMSRHRFNQPQQQQSSSGIVHSPGPSGTPQTGPTVMPSPNDNDIQQNTSSGQQDSFGHINGSSSASSLTRSPSHVMSQPAPAFPPPPASENNSDQSSHANNNNNMMNGNSGPSQMSQFSQQQSHTMEYMPSFESPQSMKHSPQQLHNPTMNDVIASMNNGLPNEFCQPMMPNGPPSSLTPFPSEHAMRVSQSSLHMGMPPISQIHMMQHSLGSHHGGSLAMQSMPGQIPSIPGSFMAHPGGPLNNNPSFPVRDDY